MTRSGLSEGGTVGPYLLEKLIGRGASGEVYRATREGNDRPIALKLVSADYGTKDELTARFVRESETMRALSHPGIVGVLASGAADGHLYLAMPLLGGGTSLRMLLAGTELEPGQALTLLRGIGEALDYAHSQGVVHRDVKPGNILMDADGHPVLADFGLAKVLDDTTLSKTMDSPRGTPTYIPPEQVAGGKVDHRADLYSLACIAFEMLTGSPPYREQDSYALLMAHATKPVPRATERAPHLPAAVNAVFVRALAKEPAERYPSSSAFVDGLATALDGPAIPRRRGRLMAASGAAVGVVAVVVALLTLHPFGSPAPPTDIPPHAATSATVPRGQVLYRAQMDGTSNSFVDLVNRGGNTGQQAVRYTPGALELAVLGPDGDAGIEPKIPSAVTDYVADMDLAVQPGTNVEFAMGLRWAIPHKLAYQLEIATAADFAQFVVYNGEQNVPITPRLDLPGFSEGRVVALTVVVRDTHLTLLVNGKVAADVEDHQVPPARTFPGLDAYGTGGTSKGVVDVRSLDLYALA